jgi:hypothetical protein
VDRRRPALLAIALLLGAGAVTAQQPAPEAPATKIDLAVDRFEFERSDAGVAFVAAGSANAPDRTRARLVLRLEHGEGAALIVEVTGGRFTGRLGPFRRRVLPGLYEVEAMIDLTLQREELTPQLSAAQITSGKAEVRVGTPEEAAAEREKLRLKYVQTLEILRTMNGELDMWGSAVTMRSIALRTRYANDIPAAAVRGLDNDWSRFSDEFLPSLAAVRFDLQQLGEFVLAGYFPQLVPLLEQIITTLERWHASFSVTMLSNLGRPVPHEVSAKGGFPIDDLRRALRSLAEQGYTSLSMQPVPWRTIDGALPERLEDAQGDLFHSLMSKFEVRKPSDFSFRNGNSPSMRLRMMPTGGDLVGRIVTGVELRDYAMSDSMEELAELDEAMTRSLHAGFELKRVKRLTAPDNTMPNNIRPGQEITFSTVLGEKKFQVLQYSLFCRWHKRTYTLVCIAEDGLEARLEPTFRSICDSFKVLDAPFLHEGDDH